ncbi:MAG: Hpt domain-containing protein [Bacteroidota bacterium]
MSNATFHLDFTHLLQLTGEDSEFIIEVLEIIESESPDVLADMQSQLHSKSYKKLSATAHKYKSSINILGSQELDSLVKSIELGAKQSPNHQHLTKLLEDFEFACQSLMRQISQQLTHLRSQV